MTSIGRRAGLELALSTVMACSNGGGSPAPTPAVKVEITDTVATDGMVLIIGDGPSAAILDPSTGAVSTAWPSPAR